MKIRLVSLILLFFAAFVPATTQAFPELVRHGYMNCTSCHVSPSGGGLLTAYGRALSNEALSSAGGETEGDFLYGLIRPPEGLLLGGDVRAIQTRLETPNFTRGRFFLMQAEVQAAYKLGRVTGLVTYGTYDEIDESRSHYLIYQIRDQLSVRAGKFRHQYGINTPDHEIETKTGLGWDQGSETYNVEAAWIAEDFNFYLTGLFGRPDLQNSNREKGVAFSSSYAAGETYKIGLNYFYGEDTTSKRHVFGPHGILGFTERFFLLSELGFQSKNTPTESPENWTDGFVTYNRIDYEVLKGFHVYLTQEFSKLNFKDSGSLKNTYGLGSQFFPRPHIEINAQWLRSTQERFSGQTTDIAWLLLHYYL